MSNRWMAVVLGAAVLAVPGTALAKNDHAKKDGASKKTHKHEKKAKKDKGSKAKKPVSFVFKGVYKGAGVVTVAKGNSHVRKGGYVGQDVTFDMSAAKLVVADTDGVPGVTVADLQVGDELLVQARQARGTKAVVVPVEETAAATPETEEAPAADEAPSAIKARKVVDKTHPPVEEADDEAPAAA